MRPFYRSPSFWMATLLTVFAIAPLLRPGYFWGAHDARHDVYFIQQYNLTWNEGTLFPRWSPDWAFGYGYPFFNIYAPGSSFLGALLHRLLPLSLEAAVEGMFIITILISAWAMWLFVASWLGEAAALVAAVAYVYAPYHLLDIYVRAAMAESLALAVLPLALWGARRAVLRPGPGGVIALAAGYALLHLSSNLVALIFTPVLGAYVLVLAWGRAREQKTGWKGWLVGLMRPGLGLALGLGLAAFFVLPAVLEYRFINTAQWFGGYYNFHDHFVYLAQLFDPRWGFGISTPGPDDSLSYQLGLAPFALAALAAWRWWRRPTGPKLETGFWLALLLASAWLTTAASAWAWDHLPLVASAQFPWRYLTLAVVALAALAPAVLLDDDTAGKSGNPSNLAALLLAGLIIVAASPYLRVEIVPPPPGGATLAGLMEFQRSADEMTGVTIAAQQVPTWSPIADLHIAGKPIENHVDYSRVPQNETLAVDVRQHSIASETVWVHAGDGAQHVPFLRQWYPGWTATLLHPTTGQTIDRFAITAADTYPPYGLLNVPIPAGDHLLRLSFEDTPIRRISKLISLAACLVLAMFFVWKAAARYMLRTDARRSSQRPAPNTTKRQSSDPQNR